MTMPFSCCHHRYHWIRINPESTLLLLLYLLLPEATSHLYPLQELNRTTHLLPLLLLTLPPKTPLLFLRLPSSQMSTLPLILHLPSLHCLVMHLDPSSPTPMSMTNSRPSLNLAHHHLILFRHTYIHLHVFHHLYSLLFLLLPCHYPHHYPHHPHLQIHLPYQCLSTSPDTTNYSIWM